ncbi:MAG: dimethylsulfonioproprionate lyase family protein [Pseudomonadota bacterium]
MNTTTSGNLLLPLKDEVLGTLKSIDAPGAEGRDMVRHAISSLNLLTVPTPRAGMRPEPVARYGDELWALARGMPTAGLASKLLGAAEELVWHDAVSVYGPADTPDLRAFNETYFFTSLVASPSRGRQEVWASEDVMVAFTFQGPETLYPAHNHENEEFYIVVSGTCEWQRGDKRWRPMKPGDFLLHESLEPHAMRTGSEPLLCMCLWRAPFISTIKYVD